MNIQNAVTLVTGANRGLGVAFTRALLEGGARKVYGAARNPIAIDLPGVQGIRLDVTRPEQIAEAVQTCGDVHILINNAGIALSQSFLATDNIQDARAEMETNYFGPLYMSRAFAPVLKRNGGGAIINVLSVVSWINFEQVATYCASKAAAWSLTNGLRNELRGQGTQVLALHVGPMDTDMGKNVQSQKADPNVVARQTLAAPAEGKEEFLADELSRQVKRGLSADPGIYIEPLQLESAA